MSTLYAPEDFFSRLAYARRRDDRGVAFCFGSGLTAPRVPGTEEAVKWMTYSVDWTGPEREAFKEAIGDATGGAAYQAGARFILGRRGQSTLNEVVRAMVLNAHKPTLDLMGQEGASAEATYSEAYCSEAEADPEAWYLPDAVVRLGEALAAESAHGQVRIVTTNFDPLIEIAVRRAGGTAITQVFGSDGSLGAVTAVGGVMVAHLHGFWREGDTLHVPAQLDHPRPLLQVSLEDLFSERTVVVSGYGGWDDVFTNALTEAVRRHRNGEMDVLWAFRSADHDQVNARYGDLLDRFSSVLGRVTFFAGIECGEVFPASAEGDDAGGVEDDAGFTSPLAGWSAISPQFVGEQADLAPSKEELVRFFDGQVPAWRHAVSDSIPLLAPAQATIEAVDAAATASELGVVVLQGPSGEGKTMAAKQVAVHYAQQPGWQVIWQEPGVPVSIDADALTPVDGRWLLVIDGADAAADQCLAAVRTLHERGRDDVQLLLATRTTDWRVVRAPAKPWSEYARYEVLDAGGLAPADALAVVELWESAGSPGLGQLANEQQQEGRVTALLGAARNEAQDPAGSFLGAMLRVRIGDGLRDHVRTLGERLRERHVHSGQSLLRAFLYVASLHSHGILTLQSETLANALSIDPGDVYREVVWPLGEEAALTGAGSGLQVRHRALAEEAMALTGDWGEDPAAIYYEIIRAAAQVRHSGTFVADLPKIVFLPGQLISQPRVALRAARAPVDVEPYRQVYRTNLAAIMRKVGHAAEGIEQLKVSFEQSEKAPDPENLRSALYEWGVCAGVLNRPAANAYLCLIAISDDLGRASGKVTPANLSHIAGGIEDSLNSLAGAVGDGWIDGCRRAATEMNRAADGGDAVKDAAEIVAALELAGRKLPPLLEEELPSDLSPDGQPLAFAQVRKLLAAKAPSSSRGSPS